MKLSLLTALMGLVFCCQLGTAAPSSATSPDERADQLAAILKDFQRAAARPDYKAREAALKLVVDFGHEDSIPALLTSLGKAAKVAADAEEKIAVDQIMLERRRVQLAQVELAFERNKELKNQVAELKGAVDGRQQALARGKKELKREEPWRDHLRSGAGAVVNAQATGKRRALVKELWKTFEKGKSERDRLMSAWILVDLGEEETTKRFGKVLLGVLEERAKMKRGLPPLEAKVRNWERKIQDETRKFGGTYKETTAAYAQVQAEAQKYNDELIELEQFGHDLIESAGRALALEVDPEQGAAELIKMARKSPHQEQLIEIFVHSGLTRLAPILGKELESTKLDMYKLLLVEAMTELGARDQAEPWLLDAGLSAEYWLMRSRAALALAKLRSRDAIPLLIAMLESEEGRGRTDVTSALVSLTGQDFHGNLTLWKRWWGDNEAGFEVSAEAPPSSEDKALEAVGMTFFGMRTESQKVLFVLDVSGSMNEPMKTYENASGSGETRITVAKRELLRALQGIKDGGTFNIVMYATDVWTWAEEPVEMDPEVRLEVTEFINNLEIAGGTNLYGAVKVSLGMARGKAKKKGRGAPKWTAPIFDTIFLLSDGAPSQGLSIDRNDILDMAVDENADMGVTINTIGLSMGQDVVLMRLLAEQTGGTYVAR